MMMNTHGGFLADHFPGLTLKQPLFYLWDKALRFDLQEGSTSSTAYFEEVLRRATALFEAAFAPTDTLWLVMQEYRFKRQKIRFANYCFRQIAGLQRADIRYTRAQHLYEPKPYDLWNVAAIELTVDRLHYRNVLKAIANTDFPDQRPRMVSGKNIYLINTDRKIIFHMYDDRGLDILAHDLETLRPLYERFNTWLLDYDRPVMDQTMTAVSQRGG